MNAVSALATGPGAISVLVVDDDDTTRGILTSVLTGFGFGSVLEACDGEAAADTLRNMRVDLVICDVKMDGMNGLALVRLVRSGADAGMRHTRNVPIIMLTSYGDERVIAACHAAGANAYIVKPLRPLRLIQRIAAVCRVEIPKLTELASKPSAIAMVGGQFVS
ncbi:response regulator [Azospirillum sp. RWY-5-1]|uniref:Response regulator n=1 Tax=Azospirillum oleiclasticum TaxID=2735135 RepID=A0ABX2TJD8_9PROT|nr:response regulator [Azospirillum oleiclasticum]NYZ16801.1 response regulator [Azospirillum oleiclasticum]NYZ24465.1 response regulator [Azospirillum oleiclasticum]